MSQPNNALVFLIITFAACADDRTDQDREASGLSISAFPESHLYPANIADPHRPTFMISAIRIQQTTVEATSERRVGIKAGGRLGLIRAHPADNSGLGFQLNLDVGFSGQFDAGQSWDLIGWNGVLGLIGQYRFNPRWATKFGLNHFSSHLGDEYTARTGRQRISYTREEFQAGANWKFYRRWELYAEAGYGFRLSNEVLQKPWRLQSGIQIEPNAGGQRRSSGWYAALDFSATEERDYSINTTFQTGFTYRSGPRRYRAGIEIYDGQMQIGELFDSDDQYISLGVWADI